MLVANQAGRVVDNPQMWSSSTLALVHATVIAILFGFAMSQRLMRQRAVLAAARQEAVIQREKTAAIMRERSLLFAATNHDLRQPLIGVSLFADLLKSARTPVEREAHSRKLDMALKEVDELLVCIQQLAAVHESSHHPVFETVKLDDLLLPVVEESLTRLRRAYDLVVIEGAGSPAEVNLRDGEIVNMSIDRGDRVLVGCRRGGGLRLVIADTGRGMSEEQTRRAFDAFQRFDSGVSISDGFGLGLFSSKSLANALGLAISLHSREGRGTEFRIFLPPFEGRAVNAALVR